MKKTILFLSVIIVSISCGNQQEEEFSSIAEAGANQNVSVDTANLHGSGTGTIVEWKWFSNDSTVLGTTQNITVHLNPGENKFWLGVKDNNNHIGKDSVTVTYLEQ